MNILPKKRWHVRTKDNIARVRRDEAQAAEEEKQRVQRAKLAEQEARTAFLRNKARSNFDGGYGEAKKAQEADIYTSDGNINFFKDLEEGKNTKASNEEYEEEKKAEQEKYEKKIGYLTYLGQDSVEATGGKAWYELDASKVTQKDDVDVEFHEVGLKSKNRLDPINDIIKYTGMKIGKTYKITPKLTIDTANCSVNTVPNEGNQIQGKASSPEYFKYHCKKRKKHKKEHKKRKKLKKRWPREYSSDDDEKKIRDKERHRNSKRGKDSCSDNDSGLKKRRKIGGCRKSHEKDQYKQKCKRKHKSKSRSSSSSNNSSSMSGSSSQSSCDDEEIAKEKQRKLEVLRAERLKREAEERQKAEKLLAGKKSDSAETPCEIKPTFQQKYNSQYNPNIARQNQEPKTLEAGVKYWLQ